MAGDSARVLLEEHSLTVELTRESPLLSGVHRIYFLNVLGFDASKDPLGYVITSHPSAPSLLLNVVDYLREQEVKAKFNERAQKTIGQLNSASSDLSQGREAGRTIKSAPPKSVEVPKLRRPLKPYQVPAVAHAVAVKNAANFSVPGSGKTAIVLSVFANLLHLYEGNVSAIGDCFKLLGLDGSQRKAVVVIGYEHSPPRLSLDPLFAAFEVVARNVAKINLGPRFEVMRKGLVHPVHQELIVAAWEVSGRTV